MPFKSQGNSYSILKKGNHLLWKSPKRCEVTTHFWFPLGYRLSSRKNQSSLVLHPYLFASPVFNLFVLAGSSSTTGTTMLATSEISLTAATATSPVANTVGEAATVVLAEGVANLKRPTTLALKCKSTPRNPKCNFLLSSSKCLYHNTKVDKKRNIFVRLTSLGKEKNVITSVALKTSVTRSQR